MKAKAEETWNEADLFYLANPCCANSAASRYYFAVLQSILAYTEKHKVHVVRPTGKGGWHKYVVDVSLRVRGEEKTRPFLELQGLRRKADYDPNPVLKEDLDEQLISRVETLFRFFCQC